MEGCRGCCLQVTRWSSCRGFSTHCTRVLAVEPRSLKRPSSVARSAAACESTHAKCRPSTWYLHTVPLSVSLSVARSMAACEYTHAKCRLSTWYLHTVPLSVSLSVARSVAACEYIHAKCRPSTWYLHTVPLSVSLSVCLCVTICVCLSVSCRRGVALAFFGRIGEVTFCRARLVLAWLTIFRQEYHFGM